MAAIAEAIARMRTWTGKDQDMGDLAGIAERLRVVKLAQRRFLRLWDIERALIDPLVERVAAELDSSSNTEDVDAEPLAGTATAITGVSAPRPAVDRGRRMDDEG